MDKRLYIVLVTVWWGTATLTTQGATEAQGIPQSGDIAPGTTFRPTNADAPELKETTATAIGLLQAWKARIDERRNGFQRFESETLSNQLAMLHSLAASNHTSSGTAAITQESNRIYSAMKDQSLQLDEQRARIRQWEENFRVSAVEGQATDTLIRAEAFAVERRYRRQLAEGVKELTELLEQWVLLQDLTLARESQLATRLLVLVSLQEAELAAQPSDSATNRILETYEYYEVLESGTLREISALPEVYGDPELWEGLYHANRKQLSDPTTIVAQGTVLVVPYQERSRSFDF